MMYYDTQVIYGMERGSEERFHYNGICYYKTKTGITKKKESDQKAVRISNEEYKEMWNKYSDIFY